jgi:LPXTG-motif cell wall-anchored protein
VTLRATAVGAWDDGAAPGDTRTSSPILARTDCVPDAAPAASIADALCDDNGAEVTLTNPTSSAVDFTVSNGTSDSIVTVPTGEQRTITVETVDGVPTTITVTADGMAPVTREISTCVGPVAAAAPAAEIGDATCIDHGSVVQLTNTGGEAVDFTITVPGAPDSTTTVPAGETVAVTVPTPADTMRSITVRAPGMADSVLDVTYTCAVAAGTGDDAGSGTGTGDIDAAIPTGGTTTGAGELPRTGSNTMVLLQLGLVTLIVGLTFVRYSRKLNEGIHHDEI